MIYSGSGSSFEFSQLQIQICNTAKNYFRLSQFKITYNFYYYTYTDLIHYGEIHKKFT